LPPHLMTNTIKAQWAQHLSSEVNNLDWDGHMLIAKDPWSKADKLK
jgi:hypothetical protein